MFTGLIEAVGRIRDRRPLEAGLRLRIEAPFADELREGESVAVDGVCLTVTGCRAGSFDVEVVRNTLARSALADAAPGRPVNLERALRACDRLGGHFVQGHVDGVGRVEEVVREGETVRLGVELPPEVARVTVPRGSLSVDGVSLTVAGLSGAVAEFAIIPYTWNHTALGRLAPGARVNLEADLLGRYVERLLAPHLVPSGRPGGNTTGGMHG